MFTFAMLPRVSWASYSEYEIVGAGSERAPENLMKAKGIRMMRIQNESVFDTRAQFISPFGGVLRSAITASSLCKASDGSSRRDPVRIPPGTRSEHRNLPASPDIADACRRACATRRKYRANEDFAP